MHHPAFPGAGIDRNIIIMGGPHTRGKAVDRLPHYYTDVPSVTGSIKNTPGPPTTMNSLSSNSSRFKQHAVEEHRWLEHTQLNLQEHFAENTPWAAYHASRQNMSLSRPVCTTALLVAFVTNSLRRHFYACLQTSEAKSSHCKKMYSLVDDAKQCCCKWSLVTWLSKRTGLCYYYLLMYVLKNLVRLSNRIAPLRFLTRGHRRRPNLGLVCFVHFVLSVLLS